MKIAINGFGRLGRCIARIALMRDIQIVGINDVANHQNLAYLLEKDSMHGALNAKVWLENDSLNIAAKDSNTKTNNQELTSASHPYKYKKTIPMFAHKNPEELDFGALGADVVIESSGQFLQTKDVAHHLKKGVRRVIISAPASDDTKTFVLGVNHHNYAGESIISNASCTTNCLAPIAMILEREFGICEATLSTIHSYTNDQNLLDVPHRSDKRRSRAAGINIIPTSTGAAKALYKVIPSLRGKIHGHSLRVPVADVSMVDLNAYLAKSVSAKTLNELFIAESNGNLRGILGVDDDFGVSSDFLNDSRSAIVAQDLTFVLDKMCKVMAWYDNEWGYSHRILDMAAYILGR